MAKHEREECSDSTSTLAIVLIITLLCAQATRKPPCSKARRILVLATAA